ncbi:glutamate receptor ionotropic, delta-2-like [Centruroides vittatus]|uniref:glutamate receptor ionotropic, delta-2-like n=1 Tax=Centruroides vittatus TaxID=120091 RepID=UPI00350F8CF5
MSNNSYVWRVAGIQHPLFMQFDETKTKLIGGLWFPIFKVIQEKLKFSYFIVHPIDYYLGYLNENGTWTGISGKLAYHKADVVFSGMEVNYERFCAMDFSSVYASIPEVFIIKAADKVSDWNSLTKPFSLEIWIAVFLTVFIFGLALHVVLQKELVEKQTRQRWTRCRTLWNLFCTFLGQGLNVETVKRFASRFMIGLWWLSIVVLVCGYSGALMSFMTCPLTEPFPRDFPELAVFVRNGKYSCGTYQGLATWKEILLSKSENIKTLKQNIIENNNLMTVPKAIVKLNKERFAYIMPKFVIVQFISKEEMHKYVISKDYLRTVQIALPIRKNFPFKKNLTNIVTRLFEAGIIEKLLQFNAVESLPSSSQFQALSIEDIKSPLLFMGVGYLLSLMCLTFELMFANIINNINCKKLY